MQSSRHPEKARVAQYAQHIAPYFGQPTRCPPIASAVEHPAAALRVHSSAPCYSRQLEAPRRRSRIAGNAGRKPMQSYVLVALLAAFIHAFSSVYSKRLYVLADHPAQVA